MNQKYIEEIAQALAEKHVALMVGAGFSKNAEKIAVTDRYFLNWNELSDLFYTALYGDAKYPGKEYHNSLRLAQEVEVMFGRPRLEKIMKEAVPDLDYAPSKLYVKMMELPWRDVFTTNYDTLLERTADRLTEHRYQVVNCQEDLVNGNGEARILKLHGSFPSHRPFIITEEDYRTYPVRFAAFVNTVQQALLENMFCMIGFSCEDPNFVSWIGWIRDNLGKSNAQKIYMISVDTVAEARKRLLLEQNIIVIDLQELWSEKSIEERLETFFHELKKAVDAKRKKENWFGWKDRVLSYKTTFAQKTEYMRTLNSTYPGWIFLPYKMKDRVHYVLRHFEEMDGLKDIPWDEQLDYAYELVRFMDIAGRPILMQQADLFWNVVESCPEDRIADRQTEEKRQEIYLQILRAYREQARWEEYEECHKRIETKYLEYDQKQFFCACDCWKHLFRFEAKELAGKLDTWHLAAGDAYWPLIKANMFAFIGETAKAEELLADTLVLVRRQQVRERENAYLASIEESIVAMLNFIRRGSLECQEENLEEPRQKSEFTWWNENSRYCFWLNEEEEPKSETKENFNLTTTYTFYGGEENKKIFYALEYLRFLEQTGHPFRIQNVTNTRGLYRTIQYLAPYYPHWCLMQILIARDEKHLDVLFGRVDLSELSREEVDDTAREYLRITKIVMENVKSQNPYISRSIYEHSAAVLPEIISRFCYKCSEKVLDEIFDVTVEICKSEVHSNFRNTKALFAGLFEGYTVQKQNEKLGTLLQLPMEQNNILEKYEDPVCILYGPKKKQTLQRNIYNRVIFQIRQAMEATDSDQNEAALARLYTLNGLIELRKEEQEFLCQELEKSDIIRDKYFLYQIDTKKYAQNKQDIFEQTMRLMKSDSDMNMFVGRKYDYIFLKLILKDMDIQKINVAETFEILQNMLTASLKRLDNSLSIGAMERIAQGYAIAVGLLLLQEKNKITASQEEREKAMAFFEELKKGYRQSAAIDMIEMAYLGKDKQYRKEFQTQIWLTEEKELELFTEFYRTLYRHGVHIQENDVIAECSQAVFSMCVYRIISTELCHSRELWCLCEALVASKIPLQEEVHPLLAGLKKCLEETAILQTDSEQDAVYKIQCRHIGCQTAKDLQERNVKSDVIDQWKAISNSEEEFAEVRKVWRTIGDGE